MHYYEPTHRHGTQRVIRTPRTMPSSSLSACTLPFNQRVRPHATSTHCQITVCETLINFHHLLLHSYLYHCVWSVITAHNLTPEKRDNNYSGVVWCGYLDPPYAVTSPHSTRLHLLSESAVDLPIIGWIHQLQAAATAAVCGYYVDR